MTDNTKTLPSKCTRCNHQTHEVLVCDYCHGLNPGGLGMDHFTLLGLPRTFDLDQAMLQQKFFALNRHVHPDKHAEESPEVQSLSVAMASAVNNAYRTLKDPALRGAYLLELLGGKSSAADRSVPEGFLSTIMMLQEELADAKAAGDTAKLGHLGEVLARQQDGLMRRIATFFGQYEESATCEAVRTDFLDEIRKQLNAVSYVRKLLSQLG